MVVRYFEDMPFYLSPLRLSTPCRGQREESDGFPLFCRLGWFGSAGVMRSCFWEPFSCRTDPMKISMNSLRCILLKESRKRVIACSGDHFSHLTLNGEWSRPLKDGPMTMPVLSYLIGIDTPAASDSQASPSDQAPCHTIAAQLR